MTSTFVIGATIKSRLERGGTGGERLVKEDALRSRTPVADAVRRTLERELKLVAEPGFQLPALDGKPLPPRVFTSTYHDTADRRLLAAGITLRRRVENRRGLWQLKLPSTDGRLELEAGGKELPAELLALLAGVIRGRELRPVGVLRTRRDGVRVSADGSVADVTHDAVSVLEERRTTDRFGEVEIELVSGDAGVLEQLGRELRDHGAKRHDGRPKIAQVLSAASPPEQPSPDTSAHAHVQAMLEAQYRSMVAHDPGVRLGGDPEDLHQLRVATRRLRAILRAARGVIDPAWADGLRTDVAWLGAQLGPVRDSDVLRENLDAERDELDEPERKGLDVLLRILDREATAARQLLADAMSSNRYFTLLDTIELFVAAPRFTGDDTPLEAIAKSEYRKLRRAVRALDKDPSDEELHAVRIKGKRARYAAELAEGSTGKAVTRFISRAKKLQDVIGEHQDAVVAEEELRRVAGLTRSQAAALTAGRLIERLEATKRRMRRAFPKTWSRLDEAGKRAWS
jgi:CHAD domain-containing protein